MFLFPEKAMCFACVFRVFLDDFRVFSVCFPCVFRVFSDDFRVF